MRHGKHPFRPMFMWVCNVYKEYVTIRNCDLRTSWSLARVPRCRPWSIRIAMFSADAGRAVAKHGLHGSYTGGWVLYSPTKLIRDDPLADSKVPNIL